MREVQPPPPRGWWGAHDRIYINTHIDIIICMFYVYALVHFIWSILGIYTFYAYIHIECIIYSVKLNKYLKKILDFFSNKILSSSYFPQFFFIKLVIKSSIEKRFIYILYFFDTCFSPEWFNYVFGYLIKIWNPLKIIYIVLLVFSIYIHHCCREVHILNTIINVIRLKWGGSMADNMTTKCRTKHDCVYVCDASFCEMYKNVCVVYRI